VGLIELQVVVEAPGGGAGFIAGELPDGLVTVNSVPSAREVELRHRATRRTIAITFSAADGTYRFDGLDPMQEYDVIGRDWSRTYGDFIAYAILPKPY
jgi:hypothetical protein